MECLKIVESFDVKDQYLTKQLPVKWTCQVQFQGVYKIKFSYYDIKPEDLEECTIVVTIQQQYCVGGEEKLDTAQTHLLTMEKNSLPYKELTISTVSGSTKMFRVSMSMLVPMKSKTKNEKILSDVWNLRDPLTSHDYVLKVGEERFYVKKCILSSYSGYFERMFNGNFDEAMTDKTVLQNVEPTEFAAFLELLHPGRSEISEETVTFLWKLADRFDVDCVSKMCEDFLCKLPVVTGVCLRLADCTRMAIQYNSQKLMKAVNDRLEELQL